jgi:hypothetical protein
MVFGLSGFRKNFVILAAFCGVLAYAQRNLPVSVEEVEFNYARAAGIDDSFLEVAIELRANRTDATPPGDYYPRVELHLEMATEANRLGGVKVMEYYRSKVRMAALEADEDYTVFFYLAPEIVERDNLRAEEPVGWRVLLTVDGRALPNVEGTFGENLAEPALARSFLAQIQQQAPRNDGLLQPIYLTPFADREAGRRDDSPPYVREEPLPESVTGGQDLPLEDE